MGGPHWREAGPKAAPPLLRVWENTMAAQQRNSGTLSLLNVLPLLVFPLIVYNILVFTSILGQRSAVEPSATCLTRIDGRSAGAVMTQEAGKDQVALKSDCLMTVDQRLDASVFSIGMFSGDTWHVSFGDVFLALSLLLLFIEIVKATRTDSTSIINHGLSMLVAMTCIIQFVVAEGFSNSVFFLLTLMTLLDVVAGFTVTIVAAKRDFGSSGGIAGTQ
jgi:hypothetical protein